MSRAAFGDGRSALVDEPTRVGGWTRAALLLAVVLPVPLLTTSGLSFPLPAFVERVAVALVPGEAVTRDTATRRATKTAAITIGLTRSEQRALTVAGATHAAVAAVQDAVAEVVPSPGHEQTVVRAARSWRPETVATVASAPVVPERSSTPEPSPAEPSTGGGEGGAGADGEGSSSAGNGSGASKANGSGAAGGNSGNGNGGASGNDGATGTGEEPIATPVDDVQVTDPPATDPPATVPPVTEPPTTDPGRGTGSGSNAGGNGNANGNAGGNSGSGSNAGGNGNANGNANGNSGSGSNAGGNSGSGSNAGGNSGSGSNAGGNGKGKSGSTSDVVVTG